MLKLSRTLHPENDLFPPSISITGFKFIFCYLLQEYVLLQAKCFTSSEMYVNFDHSAVGRHIFYKCPCSKMAKFGKGLIYQLCN